MHRATPAGRKADKINAIWIDGILIFHAGDHLQRVVSRERAVAPDVMISWCGLKKRELFTRREMQSALEVNDQWVGLHSSDLWRSPYRERYRGAFRLTLIGLVDFRIPTHGGLGGMHQSRREE